MHVSYNCSLNLHHALSVILDLGTGGVTISFSPQRKDSKAALSEEIFEQCAVCTAQHLESLSINTL